MKRPVKNCNGGYNQRQDYGRPPKTKGSDPRTPKPGGQPTQRMLAKRAQDGTRANASK